MRDLGLDSAPDIDIYAPYQQSVLPYNPLNHMSVVIATDERPGGVAAAALGAVRDVDKDLPMPVAEPMAAVYAGSMAARRFNLLLLGTFALIAVVPPAWGYTALSPIQPRGERTSSVFGWLSERARVRCLGWWSDRAFS